MSTKQVAITGAGRGIGREISKVFLREGWRVFGLVRDAKSLEGLAGDVRFISFDATSETSVLAAAKAVAEEAGPLDALVNNAGIALSAPIQKTSTDDFNRIMMVNVTAPFLLCRELGPAMGKAGGRIVNIASTASKRGLKYTTAYCASKHALLGLTRALALELAPRGVTVNTVSPGWTETDMLSASVDRIAKSTGRSAQDARTVIEKMSPMHRVVKPEEVAEVVHFLCVSTAGAAITGSDFTIDAGESA